MASYIIIIIINIIIIIIISPTSGGRSVGIVRSRTQATEFSLVLLLLLLLSAPVV
jgi:hypothetical protein